MNSSIVKSSASNQQKLLLLNTYISPSYKKWQILQRKVFYVSSQEQVNFKTKLRNYELPIYKYGKKSFGKKLLSRQRLKNIYRLSDSNLKNVLSRVNKSSSLDLLWELMKRENSIKKDLRFSFSSNKTVLNTKIETSKSLSLYGMSLYLKFLSHNLVYLNSWEIKNSNKIIYSKEYYNLLFLLKKLENYLFLKTCHSFKISEKNNTYKENKDTSYETIVQNSSIDDTLIWVFYHLSGIDKTLKSHCLNLINKSELTFKSSKDLEYFKILMKTHNFTKSETIHKDILTYTRLIKDFISLNYDPEYNWFSKSSPHLIQDFTTMKTTMDKTRLKLSSDQEQLCEDIVSFTNTR